MPKKMTKQSRRRMLARHEEGGTFPELKKEFGITDTRTLVRNLEIAEREREQREVRVRIYTDVQQSHLSEIHELAQRWKDSIKINLSSGDFNVVVEDDDLFESLKEHFRDSSLWENYATWKEEAQRYRTLLNELAKNGNRIAKQDTGLEGPVSMTKGLAGAFVPSALWYAMNLREKWIAETSKTDSSEKEGKFPPPLKELYETRNIQASSPYAVEFTPDGKDIAYGTEESVSQCIKAHYKLINALWGNPQVIELVALRKHLCKLDGQIHHELRLSLLRRSYVSYVCDFCPVRALKAEAI